MFGGHADLSAFAAVSVKQYWIIDARLQMPRLANNRAGVEVHAQRYDFPEEGFFGLGPDSLRDNEVTYGLANTVIGSSGTYRPTPWLNVGVGVDHLSPRVRAESGIGEILSIFDPSQLPGALAQPEVFKYQASVDVNTREPRGNPRRGGRYALTYQRFDDTSAGRFSFDRVEMDLQQYVPLLRPAGAARARVDVGSRCGAEVPFYRQRRRPRRSARLTLGSATAVLLLQAERWEIFRRWTAPSSTPAGSRLASRTSTCTISSPTTASASGSARSAACFSASRAPSGTRLARTSS
jgi:hypothetical protein